MQVMASSAPWVVLARILRPQGRRGEVLADLLTDFPERFADRPRVWLAAAGFAESWAATEQDSGGSAGGEPEAAEVVSHWLPVGRNAGRIVLHFAGIEGIEQAETLAGKEVVVPASERAPLDAGATYVSDLVGCTVYDRGSLVGVVEDVQFPTTPDGSRRLEEAAALLAVRSQEGDEVLIPFASAYIVELDVGGRSIRMALPEGLVQVNRAGFLEAVGDAAGDDGV
jgi:16S rRNA processing protein RimM